MESPVLDLKAFPNTVLMEILVQLANLKVRYHFMNYKRLAIFGPASLVINLHLALPPLDVHLPIGPKQGAFTIHMMRSEPQSTQTTNNYNPMDDQLDQSALGQLLKTTGWSSQFLDPLVPG